MNYHNRLNRLFRLAQLDMTVYLERTNGQLKKSKKIKIHLKFINVYF